MIRFDFDDRYRDESVDRDLPWFARVLLADLAFYFLFAFILGPWLVLGMLLWGKNEPEKLAQVEEEKTPLVFMQPTEIPREILRARPPVAVAPPAPAAKPPERFILPGNTRPFEAGELPTPEPVRPPEPVTPPPPPTPAPPRPEPEAQIARNTPPQNLPRQEESRPPVSGVLGRALKDLDRYTQTQAPSAPANPLGGATDPEAAIQFDRKGVNFDPWLRRFVSQVRRNWFVPLSAQSFKGRVVLQFIIHRNGRITDLQVARPSDIESFNREAFNAIARSNPTEPLPAEYPDDFAPFTVTFFYNERPVN